MRPPRPTRLPPSIPAQAGTTATRPWALGRRPISILVPSWSLNLQPSPRPPSRSPCPPSVSPPFSGSATAPPDRKPCHGSQSDEGADRNPVPSTARSAVPLLQPRADTVKAPGRQVGVGDGKRGPETGEVGRQDAPRSSRQIIAILHVIKVAGQCRERDRRQ